ncbi:MAG: cyclic nucleotide-binding domain-containing protein [Spirochaetales bacterium]|jgi:CRP-like cAMP-binding protein|nr:cyclic nucleotide-binding domain-containing protein [Exilispira sp.]NMC68325.1 cyclic nucleotide-binding domain-containing protein [Spirochaetales bacterium]
MSPQLKKFGKNSIIYFTGDNDSNIYILKEGQVIISYIPSDKLEEEAYVVKPGEFFGLKSAMGKYPREETAMAATEVVAVAMNENEFLAVNGKNEQLLLKILKALSKELRETVRKVNQLTGQNEVLPDVGLFNYGMYYFKTKQYKKSKYCFQKLLELYPDCSNKDEALAQLKALENLISDDFSADETHQTLDSALGKTENFVEKVEAEKEQQSSEEEKMYYEAVNAVMASKLEEGLKLFKQIFDDSNTSEEYKSKSLLEMGKILKRMKNFDAAEKVFKKFITDFSSSELAKEAIYELAENYKLKGDLENCKKLIAKIISLQPADEITTKAKRLLGSLQ